MELLDDLTRVELGRMGVEDVPQFLGAFPAPPAPRSHSNRRLYRYDGLFEKPLTLKYSDDEVSKWFEEWLQGRERLLGNGGSTKSGV